MITSLIGFNLSKPGIGLYQPWMSQPPGMMEIVITGTVISLLVLTLYLLRNRK